ncbi:MAG: xylulose kinase [Chloroflexi bacterium]|nr:xylulose kinase [Chloroflexota bacterium]
MCIEQRPYVLAIDGGTEALKAGIFDLEGNVLGYGTAAYPTAFPQPGWAEQSPDDWWQALGAACHQSLASAGVSAGQVAAICADATTCTLLPLDERGRPLSRALLWMDVRAADQARRISATGHPALRYSLAGTSAEWMPPKALWLKEQRPEVFRQARWLVEYTDWLAFRLTGRLALNVCTATQRWYYGADGAGWPADFYAAIGLADLQEKVPADVLPLGAPVGVLTSEAAEHTGLRAGTLVVAGGGDAPVGVLGVNVVRPGALALITGSSNVLLGFAERELHVPGVMGSFPDAVIPGLHLVEAGQVSTGSVLAWFRRQFAGDLERESADGAAGVYRRLDEAAARLPPGAEGLVALDCFQGNRTPYADSLARGAIWGLSLHSTRAHVYRALLEGIAYGTRHILDTLARHGYRPTEVVAAGGATRSRLFMQIYADVCGLPLRTTDVPEASLLGAAIVAALGAGAYGSLEAAAARMVRQRVSFEPDEERHRRYAFWVQKYVQTYHRLKDLMHEAAAASVAAAHAEGAAEHVRQPAAR